MTDLRRRKVESLSASLASIAAFISWLRRSWSVIALLSRFQVFQSVADFGGFLIILALDSVVQRLLQFLARGKRPIGPDFGQPRFQRIQFPALLDVFQSRMLRIERTNVLNPFLDLRDGNRVILGLERLAGAAPRQDHDELRLKLAELPCQFVGLGMFADKTEYCQVALRIAHHAGVILQL